MKDITILHNPRCSKSRAGLALLEEKGIDATIIRYLDTPLSSDEIIGLLRKLDMKPRELMRTGEAIYKELKLKDVDDDAKLIEAMATNPKLIERPVIIRGDRAVIGRPIENIEVLLN